MSSETDSTDHPFAKRGSSNPLAIFITALSASICLALSFGLVLAAFAVAAGGLFEFGTTYLWITGGAIAIGTLWLGLWCFARAIHVERRLRAGLDVDQPDLSILANFRDSKPVAQQS
ncbi:hypothetical protein V6C03_08980 [Methyloligella sp. 2.7D]|uniref:hypothetical protein n=1 Tax=unclassified Methyloligella TaxID=2625955 RepID=UPI00157C6D3D|nr:hypothetical protein [Methyloligella sp. GL2]QKP78005.1 hypothetical protein HT051_11470 [Methyloligella sp. GL2]